MAVPLALRDELTRLIPGFDPGSASVVARLAAVPVAWKLASTAVGVGVVATGAGGLHGETTRHAQREHTAVVPAIRAPSPAATVERPQVFERVRGTSHRGRGPRVERRGREEQTRGEPAADDNSSRGPGPAPAPAEIPALEESHKGPPGGGGELQAEEDHSGSGDSGGEDGSGADGSGHSGPG